MSQGFSAHLLPFYREKFIQSSVIDVYILYIYIYRYIQRWKWMRRHWNPFRPNQSSFEWIFHTIQRDSCEIVSKESVKKQRRNSRAKKKLLIYTIHRYLLSEYTLFIREINEHSPFTVSVSQAERTQCLWVSECRVQGRKIKYDSIAISNLLWISFILFWMLLLLLLLLLLLFFSVHSSSFVKYRIKRSVFNVSFQIDLINIDEPNLDSISLVLLLISSCGIFCFSCCCC